MELGKAEGLATHNNELLGDDFPFCNLDNVVLTDHAAYSATEGVQEPKTKTPQNVIDALNGDAPKYPVNHL